MKGFFLSVGVLVVVLWLMGMVGLIDFRICINATGHCGARHVLTAEVR